VKAQQFSQVLQCTLLTAHALLQKLSPRQLRVIEMVALGLKNREIAENLGTPEQVVKNHLHKIYAKISDVFASGSEREERAEEKSEYRTNNCFRNCVVVE
jgi:DNA-binding CsgD family transcriptional regulator